MSANDPGSGLAPGVPADYYKRIAAVEGSHWWHLGMRATTALLLADHWASRDQALLDVGCGTGGFLRWADASGAFSRLAGADLSEHAIDLARQHSPELDLRVAPMTEMPFASSSFDVVTVNDVLQHVPELNVSAALRECARVMRPGATLLIRTNGARRLRRERADWRVYDRATIAGVLRNAGLQPQRITYASFLPSIWAAVRGRQPRAPHDGPHARDGIPDPASLAMNAVGTTVLAAERGWLRRGGRDVPFGHTLFAVARQGQAAD